LLSETGALCLHCTYNFTKKDENFFLHHGRLTAKFGLTPKHWSDTKLHNSKMPAVFRFYLLFWRDYISTGFRHSEWRFAVREVS